MVKVYYKAKKEAYAITFFLQNPESLDICTGYQLVLDTFHWAREVSHHSPISKSEKCLSCVRG